MCHQRADNNACRGALELPRFDPGSAHIRGVRSFMAAKLGAQAPGAANYLLEPSLMAENLNMSHPSAQGVIPSTTASFSHTTGV